MYLNLIEKINTLRENRDRVQQIIHILSRPPLVGLHSLGQKVGEAGRNLRYHIETYGHDINKIPPRERSYRQMFKSTYEELIKETKELNAQDKALRAELERLEESFQSFDTRCSSNEFKAFFDELKEQSLEGEKIADAIEQVELKIAAIENCPNPLRDLRRKQEDTRSAASLGTANEKDIEAAEKQLIAAEKKQEENKKSLQEYQQTKNGLVRKREGLEAELSKMHGYVNDIISFLLTEKALNLEAKFAESAAALKQYSEQLLAIGNLLEKYTTPSFPGKVEADRIHQLLIPQIGLSNFPNVMTETITKESLDISGALQSEMDALMKVGLPI